MIPRVSFLLPCYNAAASDWLAKSLQSILGQTYGDFEVVAVDDGSTDGTWDILQQHAALDARINCVRRGHTGLSPALNVGLQIARGEWIARIDADDLCAPARLERQLAFAAAAPELVLIGSGFVEIDGSGAVVRTHRYPARHSELVANLHTLRRFFPHSSAFFRREAALKVRGYCKRLERAEDWRLWLDLSRVGRIGCVDAPLVFVRKHAKQMSNDNSGRTQLRDAIVGVASDLLIRSGAADPLQGTDEEFDDFRQHVETELDKDGLLERFREWAMARQRFVTAPNRVAAYYELLSTLARSGSLGKILLQKVRGSGLPRSCATTWRRANPAPLHE